MRQVGVSDAHAAALAAQIAALADSQGPFVLSVSEDDLLAWARQNVGGAPQLDLALWIEPEGIHAQATSVKPELCAYALLGLQAKNGSPQLALTYAAVNGHRLPRWVLASLEKALNDVVADMQRTWRVESIELTQGQARVHGEIDQ